MLVAGASSRRARPRRSTPGTRFGWISSAARADSGPGRQIVIGARGLLRDANALCAEGRLSRCRPDRQIRREEGALSGDRRDQSTALGNGRLGRLPLCQLSYSRSVSCSDTASTVSRLDHSALAGDESRQSRAPMRRMSRRGRRTRQTIRQSLDSRVMGERWRRADLGDPLAALRVPSARCRPGEERLDEWANHAEGLIDRAGNRQEGPTGLGSVASVPDLPVGDVKGRR